MVDSGDDVGAFQVLYVFGELALVDLGGCGSPLPSPSGGPPLPSLAAVPPLTTAGP